MIERVVVGFFGAALTAGSGYIFTILGYELFQPPSRPGGSVVDGVSALLALLLLPVGFAGVCGACIAWGAVSDPPDTFDIDEEDEDDQYGQDSV